MALANGPNTEKRETAFSATLGQLAPRGPLLIDGGLSTVLKAAGHDLNHPLWTARLIDEQPAAIVDAHRAYLRAGARAVITASYQLSFAGYRRLGRPDADADAALRQSVALARQAIGAHRRESGDAGPYVVAASIGPYGAFLADGSEYRGDYRVTDRELEDFHRRRLDVLNDTDADCLAVETIPSFREAAIIAALLESDAKPAWVAFSCRDGGHICDGTPITACADALRDHAGVFAMGINCTAPRHVGSLITALEPRVGNKRIVVYPNAGGRYDATRDHWQNPADSEDFATRAQEWVRGGASIIGGCCRIGPDQISQLARALAPAQ